MKKNVHPNSLMAWRRNSLYFFLGGIRNKLHGLLHYPTISEEKDKIEDCIKTLNEVLYNREKNIEKFGKENNFKKYRDEKTI